MNYKSLLKEINNASMASSNITTINVPSNKVLYNIDLSTREVEAPQVLSIQSEHYAETVYFICDRYYDYMDLAQTNCVVQYTIGDKSYVYAVPFCDTTTYENKIVIPWSISISATETAGTIKFFIRFYLIDNSTLDTYNPEDIQFSYSLSTLVASSKILKTLPQEDFREEDKDFNAPEGYFRLIQQMNTLIDNSTVYWIDV